MPAHDVTGEIGQFKVAPPTNKLSTIANYDKGLGFAGRERYAKQPASYMTVPFHVAAVAADANADSGVFMAPFPLRVLQAIGAATHGAGVTGVTIDVLADRSPAYAGPASVLEGATGMDQFAAGDGLPATRAAEDGQEQINHLDRVHVNFATAGGAAGITDAVCWLVCQRL